MKKGLAIITLLYIMLIVSIINTIALHIRITELKREKEYWRGLYISYSDNVNQLLGNFKGEETNE
jgi:hypothetical protein